MFSDEARTTIEAELERGRRARADGFEGRARVCARRAAGVAVREFFRLSGTNVIGSAHELLKQVEEQAGISPRAKQSAALLLTRVDEDFRLADGVDLLQEARALANDLESALQ